MHVCTIQNTYKKNHGEKEQCCILLGSEQKAKSFAHHTTSAVSTVQFVGRADFDFFVRFDNSACCINARRHVGSRLSPTLFA